MTRHFIMTGGENLDDLIANGAKHGEVLDVAGYEHHAGAVYGMVEVAPYGHPTMSEVIGYGGHAIALQCPRCLFARPAMPVPPKVGACPVCAKTYRRLRSHLSRSKCGKWYRDGWVVGERPAWAPFGKAGK